MDIPTPIPSDELDEHGRGYSRSRRWRATWYSLNGNWDFATDAKGEWPTSAGFDAPRITSNETPR